jgi:hypothetical protein
MAPEALAAVIGLSMPTPGQTTFWRRSTRAWDEVCEAADGTGTLLE